MNSSAEPFFDFEWHIAPDFDWVDWVDAAGKVVVADAESLKAPDINGGWDTNRLETGPVLTPRDGTHGSIFPMRREHAALFRLFAELDASNIEALRAFAKRYGWLGKLPRQSQPPSQGVKFAEGESQLTWAIEIARMRKAVRWLDKRPPTLSGRDREWWDWLFNVQLQGVQARISFAEEGPKTLRLAPTTLLSAMWLQLAMAVAWNKSFVKCKFCQTSIEISTAESGFRTNREFCSDSCKTKDYRKRKRTAKRLVEKGKSIAAISTEISTDEKTVRGWFPQLERRSGAKSGRAR